MSITPITVPVAELSAVARWASSDNKQPHLRKIAFRANEYVACDGWRLVRVPCETHGHEFGVERQHVEVAIAAHRTVGHLRPTIDILPMPQSNHVAFHVGSQLDPTALQVMAPLQLLDDYLSIKSLDTVMAQARSAPRSPTFSGYAFDPRFLSAIAEVHAPGHSSTNNGSVVIEAWSATRDGAVFMRNDQGIRFLVMPIQPHKKD